MNFFIFLDVISANQKMSLAIAVSASEEFVPLESNAIGMTFARLENKISIKTVGTNLSLVDIFLSGICVHASKNRTTRSQITGMSIIKTFSDTFSIQCYTNSALFIASRRFESN